MLVRGLTFSTQPRERLAQRLDARSRKLLRVERRGDADEAVGRRRAASSARARATGSVATSPIRKTAPARQTTARTSSIIGSVYPLKETILLEEEGAEGHHRRAPMSISLWPVDVWYSGSM